MYGVSGVAKVIYTCCSKAVNLESRTHSECTHKWVVCSVQMFIHRFLVQVKFHWQHCKYWETEFGLANMHKIQQHSSKTSLKQFQSVLFADLHLKSNVQRHFYCWLLGHDLSTGSHTPHSVWVDPVLCNCQSTWFWIYEDDTHSLLTLGWNLSITVLNPNCS